MHGLGMLDKISEFEKALAKYTGAPYAIMTDCCTHAIEMCLRYDRVRGTLQEELCNDIAREIMKATDANDVAVYVQAVHGCCENRGIMAHSSLTQTTVLKGAFQTDQSTKKEFFDNIKLQQEFAPR